MRFLVALFVVGLVGEAGCGAARSAPPSNPAALDLRLAAKYMRVRADLLDKNLEIQKPLNDVVQEMLTDCKVKKLGDQINLDANGVPACFAAPKPPVAAPAAPSPEKK